MFDINLREKGISIVKLLLIYQFLIMTRAAAPIISPDVKKILDESLMAKHLMGIIFMVVTLQSFTEIRDPIKTIFISLVTYLMFVLTNQLNLNMFIIIMLGLLTYLFYENSLINTEKLVNTNTVNDETKKKIIEERENTKIWSVIGIISILIFGILILVNKKKNFINNNI